MQIRYARLFTIECLHGYFADHLCKVLTLTPSAECRRLLERYQMIFRPLPGGGAVYFAVSDAVDYLALFNEISPFVFVLTSSDPALDNYTASDPDRSPASPADSIHYFNNLSDRQAEVFGVRRQLLHAPSQGSATLPVRPRQFNYIADKPLRNAQLELCDALWKRPVWRGNSSAQASSVIPLDLAGVASGAYSLKVDGADRLDFYLSDLTMARQWGIVEIFIGGAAMAAQVPAACRALDGESGPQTKTFTIALENRKTVWRYCVISQAPQERGYEQYEVLGLRKNPTDSDPQSATIPFVLRQETMTVNGKQALVFESTEGIPLLQVPADAHAFTLKPGPQMGRGARSYKLPYAPVDGLMFERDVPEARALSAIYVYL